MTPFDAASGAALSQLGDGPIEIDLDSEPDPLGAACALLICLDLYGRGLCHYEKIGPNKSRFTKRSLLM